MMPASNWGLGANMGPLFLCPDGTSAFSPAQCPGGVPAAQQPSPDAALQQIQAEIEALYNYTGAGQAPVISSAPGFDWSSIPIWAWGAGAFLLALVFFGGRRR